MRVNIQRLMGGLPKILPRTVIHNRIAQDVAVLWLAAPFGAVCEHGNERPSAADRAYPVNTEDGDGGEMVSFGRPSHFVAGGRGGDG